MSKQHTVKHYGRVYTPKSVVNRMLQPLFSTDLMDMAICDPSCGTGDFLVPIATEICHRMKNASGSSYKHYLSALKKLTGYDIDRDALAICRQRLGKVFYQILGKNLPFDWWRVIDGDALEEWSKDKSKFDWVVGNPPYVRVQNLEAYRREKIRKGGWQWFQGSGDLYTVFFELGLHLLRDKGELIYISPSSWLRNDAGATMRKNLLQHGIVSVYDYRDHQVFEGHSTYTCITHLMKNNPNHTTIAYIWNGKRFTNSCSLDKSSAIWSVSNKPKRNVEETISLDKIADIHVGIQTLCDRVFILEEIDRHKGLVTCRTSHGEVILESRSVKRILKASVMKKGRDPIKRVIIYPYDRDGKLISESFFKFKFPRSYRWLKNNKETLLSRDKGQFDKKKWYGFGREVGIRTGFGKKILTSAMNPHPNFQICNDPQSLFYSGYCIKPTFDIGLDDLANILNSCEMAEHIEQISQPFRGGWFSYAKRYIGTFTIPRGVLNAQA